MEKYEDPTQRLQSKVPSGEYKSNYDKIFGKKKYWYEKQLELDLGETQEFEPRFGYPVCDKCRNISPVTRNGRDVCKELNCKGVKNAKTEVEVHSD